MSRRGLGLLGVAMALVVALAIGWAPDKAPAPVQLPSGNEARVGAEDEARDPSEPGPAPNLQRASLPPLPPAETPVDLAAADWLLHARHGSGKAACRLGLHLLKCRESVSRQRFGVGRPANDGTLDPEAVRHLEEAFRRDAALAATCARLAPETDAETTRLLALAAAQGIPAAMLHYAEGRHWQMQPGFAATAEFDAWRRDAPRMLRAARDAGHPAAPFVLANAYSSEGTLIGALIPDDPTQSAAHRMLGTLLAAGPNAPLEDFTRKLDAEELEQARRLARQMHTRAYGSARAALTDPGMPEHYDPVADCPR